MRVGLHLLVSVISAIGVTASTSVAYGQTAENVVVVINDNSPESRRIGEHYVRKRTLPATNVFRLRTSVGDEIDRTAYLTTIEAPIAMSLGREGLQDRILYLVLTKGIPLRIRGSEGQNGARSSVDSELTLLYRRMTGGTAPVAGRIDNPYFARDRDPSATAPFTHKDFDIYLVTRLDAFTADEAIALVDKGSAPVRDGRIVLDQQDSLVTRAGEDWLAAAASRLTAQGHAERVLLESTVNGARDINPVLGYYSWGSNDPRNRVRTMGMGFVPGSLAATYVSTDARTFKEPSSTWVPSSSTEKSAWFEGTPQSLVGDLIREGVTGVAGQVAEPYLQSAIRPDILFPAYLGGSNLVEAFYAAMPHLSWQTVVVGDPLCAPFRRRTLTRGEIEGGTDDETTLPAFFSQRRVKAIQASLPGVPERAVALSIRGDALEMRGDRAGARAAWEQATALAPQIASAQFQLALVHDQAGQTDLAIERYRATLASQPGNWVALNNLAYKLAVDRKAPAEALPLATQAVKLAPPGNPTVLDTLAWVQHLSGDHATAAKTMAAVLKSAPNHPEIRLHAATIYAASGALAVAEDNLKEALRLNPALEQTPAVKQLRQQLEKSGSSK